MLYWWLVYYYQLNASFTSFLLTNLFIFCIHNFEIVFEQTQ